MAVHGPQHAEICIRWSHAKENDVERGLHMLEGRPPAVRESAGGICLQLCLDVGSPRLRLPEF